MVKTNKNKHFCALRGIVAEAYGLEPDLLTSRVKLRDVTTPRNILAGILSMTGEPWQVIARRMGWCNASTAYRASKRFVELSHHPQHAHRIGLIIAKSKEALPWLLLD